MDSLNTCSVCGCENEFLPHPNQFRPRINSVCPVCGSVERTRLLKLVMDELDGSYDFSTMSCAHFAPGDGELQCEFHHIDVFDTPDLPFLDLTDTGFEDNQYNVLIASHVLEHIPDDYKALSEIARVTSFLAILPVPAYKPDTVEFLAPNNEDHVRDTGLDYYETYEEHFLGVDVYTSSHYPDIYQTRLMIDSEGGRGAICTPVLEDGIYDETIPVCYV